MISEPRQSAKEKECTDADRDRALPVQPSERTALAEKVVDADGFKVGKPASIEVSKRFAVPVSMTFTVDPAGGPLPVGVGLGLPLSVDAIPPLGVEGVVSNGQVPPHAQAHMHAHRRTRACHPFRCARSARMAWDSSHPIALQVDNANMFRLPVFNHSASISDQVGIAGPLSWRRGVAGWSDTSGSLR